jgi:hypothetical protein
MSETSQARHPADTLLNLIVTLMTPMFLAAADGNLAFARQAATETLNAYRAETQSDLITIAKIVAFGLAALAVLSLSMAEDLSVTTVLRLHASANASDRSEHRNRGVLKQSLANPQPTPPARQIDEAALAAAAADMQVRTAAHLAQFSTPASGAAPSIAEQARHDQATWAASAAAIAAETAAALPTMPPGERASAAIWIDVLNESAKDFMAGDIVPRPHAPAPGDLGAMLGDPEG